MLKSKGIDRINLITDATSLAGFPDGDYGSLPDRAVTKTGGKIVVSGTNTLAGSALDMNMVYKNAAKFFLKVYELDPERLLFNDAQLQYALMLKQQGLYKEALAQLKEVKQYFSDDKTTPLYKKAAQEVSACTWVLKQLKNQSADEKAELKPSPINTLDVEFAHTILNKRIYFSALKPDSVATDQIEVFAKTYRLQLYVADGLKKTPSTALEISNLTLKMSVGNISFTADSSAFLCAVCQEKQSSLEKHCSP